MHYRSKSGSLREFLNDYDSIINNTNQAIQSNERTAESGYRSESTTYEESFSTTRYSDFATPEHSLPVKNTSYSSSNPTITVHFPGDSSITTETTISSTTAITKVANGSKFPENNNTPRASVSPVPSISSPIVSNTETTTTKSGAIVSALTQQFEMNTSKQSIDESISSRPISGNQWSPK
ncbi:hypothetical protein LOAG_18779, partial [Loa loa]